MDGAYLKRYRKINKITQAQMAEDIGKTQTDVSRMESGRDPISPDILEIMVTAGVIPEDPKSNSQKLRSMLDIMNHEDKALMLQFAARILR